MRRLLVVTPAELTRDPRARRQVAAGLEAGMEAIGLCGQISGEADVPLEYLKIIRVGRRGRPLAERRDLAAPRRESGLVRELRGLYRLLRLAVRSAQLWRGGRQVGDFDVVHANDLDTLPAAWLLARRVRARLVYDAHELYTAVEPNAPRVYGHVADRVESALARRADSVVTVTEPLADELRRRFELRERPHVVLNCPTFDPAEPPEPHPGRPLRTVYQASVGHTRVIEDLFDALDAAPGVELMLRVVGADIHALRRQAAGRGLAERVAVELPVAPDEIVPSLRGFDVGLVIDRRIALNTDLAIPNKLFEYLMAGLAVLVPDAPAMAHLVEAEGVGSTFEAGSGQRLGEELARLSTDRNLLAAQRRRARNAAVERYNAEAQRGALFAAWALSSRES